MANNDTFGGNVLGALKPPVMPKIKPFASPGLGVSSGSINNVQPAVPATPAVPKEVPAIPATPAEPLLKVKPFLNYGAGASSGTINNAAVAPEIPAVPVANPVTSPNPAADFGQRVAERAKAKMQAIRGSSPEMSLPEAPKGLEFLSQIASLSGMDFETLMNRILSQRDRS